METTSSRTRKEASASVELPSAILPTSTCAPVLEAVRAQDPSAAAALSPAEMPPCMARHGMPPRVPANLALPSWLGHEMADECPKRMRRIPWRPPPEDLIGGWRGRGWQCAAAVIAKHRGDFTQPEPQPLPPGTVDPTTPGHLAPVSIGADGSLHTSKPAWTALGCAGMVHAYPHRLLLRRSSPEAAVPAIFEEEVADWRASHSGTCVERWAPHRGRPSSPTRVELQAGLIAALSPGPVHFCTDSFAFARGHQALDEYWQEEQRLQWPPWPEHALDENRRPIDFRQPWHWHKMPDGDLWEEWVRLMHAKGWHGVRITHVRVHMEEKDVLEGRVTREGMELNKRAHEAAQKGHAGNGEALTGYAALAAQQQEAYARHIRRLHWMQVALLKAHHRVREQIEPPATPLTATHTHTPEMHGCGNADRCFTEAEWDATGPGAASPLHAFLRTTTWQRVREGEQGISWLEFLIAYEQQSGAIFGDTNPQGVRKRFTVLVLARMLGRAVRACIHKHSGDQRMREAWRPAPAKLGRLRGLGIGNAVACMQVLPVWDRATWMRV